MSSAIGKEELRRLVKVVSTLTFEPQKVSKRLMQSLDLFLNIAEDELKIKQEAVVTPASNAGTAGAPDKALAFADGEWHPDVKAQMDVLEKTGKLINSPKNLPVPPSPKKGRGQPQKKPRSNKHKGLAKNKKRRTPGKQPICGLYAAARCAGISMKTAENVEAFRKLCFDKHLLAQHSANWIGGTNGRERSAICRHFGCEVSDVLLSHPEYVGKTVGTLFKDADFFKTKEQYMLTVPKHCVWVRTNVEKKKLEVRDQRDKPFKPLKEGAPKSMQHLLRQHVTSLTLVTRPPAAAPPAAAPSLAD